MKIGLQREMISESVYRAFIKLRQPENTADIDTRLMLDKDGLEVEVDYENEEIVGVTVRYYRT